MCNGNYINVVGDTHWRNSKILPNRWRVCTGEIFKGVFTNLNEVFFIEGADQKRLVAEDHKRATLSSLGSGAATLATFLNPVCLFLPEMLRTCFLLSMPHFI
jgi:hypothetical protein